MREAGWQELRKRRLTKSLDSDENFKPYLQSGASSQAKIGGAYFSDVTGSIQDPIAVPGPCEVTEF